MEASQTLKNTAYGMQIRLNGMKMRGEAKEKIAKLEANLKEILKTIKDIEELNDPR